MSIIYLQPPIVGEWIFLYYAGLAITVIVTLGGLAMAEGFTSGIGDSDSVGTGLGVAVVSALLAINLFRRLSDHTQGHRREIALEFDLDRQRLTIRREKAGRTETRAFDLASVHRLDGFRDAGGEGGEEWGVGLLLSDGVYRTVGTVQSGKLAEFFKKMDEMRRVIGVPGDNRGAKYVKVWLQPKVDNLFSD